jgi:hypothetical protein
LENLRLNFSIGCTWFRILPALRKSAYGSILPIHALEFTGGRFVSPACFDLNKRSAYDKAQEWFQQHQPHRLYSKTNKFGFRFSPVRLGAFWVIEYSETDSPSLKLIVESSSDGSNGPEGLAHTIWKKIHEKDEDSNPMWNALHPEKGVMVCVERWMRKHSKAPLDCVRVGRIPRSVEDLLEKVSPVERDQLCVLEQVIREPNVEDQWHYLGRLISSELAAHIRLWARHREL